MLTSLGSLLVALAATLVAFALLRRRIGRGAQLNNRGLMLLQEGRVVDALATFDSAKSSLWLNPLPTYNRGVALFMLWRLAEGAETMDRASRSRNGKPLRVVAVPTLLLIAALQGDAARAADLELEVKAQQLEDAPLVTLARAVTHARAQRWSDALALLTAARVRPLGGGSRALAEAVRAWCLEQLGQPVPPVDVVGVFGEAGPQGLTKAWPELATFLDRAPTW